MNKTVRNTILSIVIMLVVGVLLASFIAYYYLIMLPKQAEEENSKPTFRIAILQYENNTMSSDIYKGFLETCDNLNISENTVTLIDYYNTQNNEEDCEVAINSITNSDCEIVLTIGETATLKLADADETIPIVFAGVTDPVKLGLIESNENPGGNITGVSNYTPCFEQMNLISETYPQAKSVGAVYSADDEHSVLQVNISKLYAETNGLTFNQYPVDDIAKLEETVTKACGENEIIYLPSDAEMLTNIRKITDITTSAKKPIIAGDDYLVRGGCFATYAVDNYELGKRVGLMLFDILINNENIAEIPVEYSNECKLYINKTNADDIGYILTEEQNANAILIDE